MKVKNTYILKSDNQHNPNNVIYETEDNKWYLQSTESWDLTVKEIPNEKAQSLLNLLFS